MGKSITSHRKAVSISAGVFLICLAVLSLTGYWWPGILLAIGIFAALKEFLRGRYYDLLLSILIFGGLFAVFTLNAGWAVIVPVLFTIGGIWILFRELTTREKKVGRDVVNEVAQSILEEEEDEEN